MRGFVLSALVALFTFGCHRERDVPILVRVRVVDVIRVECGDSSWCHTLVQRLDTNERCELPCFLGKRDDECYVSKRRLDQLCGE